MDVQHEIWFNIDIIWSKYENMYLGPKKSIKLEPSYTTLWKRQWQPTPVLLPGKSHGRRSLEGCTPCVAEAWTRLRDLTFTFHFHALEKEMATHSSVLAWRIPETGEPGRLPSMGLHRVRQDWSDLAVIYSAVCLDLSIPGPTGPKKSPQCSPNKKGVCVSMCFPLKEMFDNQMLPVTSPPTSPPPPHKP